MDIKDVRQWNCANGKAVAVNPSFDNIGKYPPLESDNKNWNEFNRWSSDPANQPATELTGIYTSEQVKVIRLCKYTWDRSKYVPVSEEWYQDMKGSDNKFKTTLELLFPVQVLGDAEQWETILITESEKLQFNSVNKWYKMSDTLIVNAPLSPVIGEETVCEAAENSLMLDSFDEQRPYTSGFINGAKWLKKQYENRIDARNS